MDGVVKDVKKGFDPSLIITILVVFILINVILSVVDMFAPQVSGFVRNPVGTIRGLLPSKGS